MLSSVSSLAPGQWDTLEIFHRVAHRVFLGIPCFAGNIDALLGAQTCIGYSNLKHEHLSSKSVFTSHALHLAYFPIFASRQQSQIRLYARNFMSNIGVLEFLPAPLLSPRRKPLNVDLSIPYLVRKTTTPVAVNQRLVAEHLAENVSDHIQGLEATR